MDIYLLLINNLTRERKIAGTRPIIIKKVAKSKGKKKIIVFSSDIFCVA